MTKHIPVCKNTTGNCEQDAEEESSASEGERVGKPTGKEAVGKPTGKTPDTQNVWDVTETVMEKRTMEEIPLSTQEQVPQHLSPERHEVTVEAYAYMYKVNPNIFPHFLSFYMCITILSLFAHHSNFF